VLKLKVGVCTHETLDKVLTEPVSSLGVDPTLDRPAMITYRSRTGQEHDLEDYPPELRPEFEKCLDPDMNIRLISVVDGSVESCPPVCENLVHL
jgi:hypothetical protein